MAGAHKNFTRYFFLLFSILLEILALCFLFVLLTAIAFYLSSACNELCAKIEYSQSEFISDYISATILARDFKFARSAVNSRMFFGALYKVISWTVICMYTYIPLGLVSLVTAG